MEKFKFITKNNIKILPKSPGVYAFKQGKEFLNAEHSRFLTKSRFLYIGKASNIRERVKNHFQRPGFRDNLFLNLVQKVGYLKTDSEIEALILEANLIKKYQPKYNVIWKDDKNFFYIGITKENLPRIFITHQPKPAAGSWQLVARGRKSKDTNYKPQTTIYIGPFIAGRPLKLTLRFLRRVFPYYTSKTHTKTPCVYCHLGLCPGPDPDIKEYKKNIKYVISVLKGKRKSVLRTLKKEMKFTSSVQDFEKAAKIRDQIRALENVFAHAKIFKEEKLMPEKDWSDIQKILQNLLKTKKQISRIEAYDVSNIQGKQATGSMVTFVKGMPDKNFYRKFKIKIEEKPNDIAMLKEILSRRLRHIEWPFPGVMLIDGGKAQLNAALQVLKKYQRKSVLKSAKISVLALAKRKNELYVENRKKPILLKTLPRPIFNLILQLRDEAHRFAISYHRKLRRKALIGY